MAVYMIILVAIMLFTVGFLMLGGTSLIKVDDQEQDNIEKEVGTALLK